MVVFGLYFCLAGYLVIIVEVDVIRVDEYVCARFFCFVSALRKVCVEIDVSNEHNIETYTRTHAANSKITLNE